MNINFINGIKPKCSMLIDQSEYIDNGMGDVEPLGHTCYNDAEFCDGIHFYCNECLEKLRHNDESITKPPPLIQWSNGVRLLRFLTLKLIRLY